MKGIVWGGDTLDNRFMRALAVVLVAAGFVFTVYYFYLKKMPTADEGTSATQNISLTGVRSDLLQIAQGERSHIVLNGHCVSLDELVSSGSLSMSRPGRDGYSYSIDCAGSDFTVTARHAGASTDPGVRYPTLAIDQTMQVHEVN